ncbi:hypothetical protein N7507_007499 [Penicillium longicatenatum]|nr:hypothetical protein N7507_007499 [Penicillium longicatenatum]
MTGAGRLWGGPMARETKLVGSLLISSYHLTSERHKERNVEICSGVTGMLATGELPLWLVTGGVGRAASGRNSGRVLLVNGLTVGNEVLRKWPWL